ncbi:MAG: DUF4062 domain-containing protein [Clostridiales bacterium]|nr:DUF4062 domain-containing protein [Clostridiales bacterium]
MEIKYQVFISSTYIDLKNERQGIIENLWKANCFPAGMEAFVASDDEQFNIIMRVIDLCDFYVLIVGDRYGSINEKTEKSFTEMEYEYALSKKIPILAFVKNVDFNNVITSESLDTRAKLKAFVERVKKNRMCSMWSSSDELISAVAISVMNAIKEYNRPGWVRNIGFASDEKKSEMNVLRERVKALEKENAELKAIVSKDNNMIKTVECPDLSQYKVKLCFTEKRLCFFDSAPPAQQVVVEVGLEELFKFVSVRLSGTVDDNKFVNEMSAYKPGYSVDRQQALVIKSQMVEIGLLEEVEIGSFVHVKLSALGKKVMQQLIALPKS